VASPWWFGFSASGDASGVVLGLRAELPVCSDETSSVIDKLNTLKLSRYPG
jgi:hypothetical protein